LKLVHFFYNTLDNVGKQWAGYDKSIIASFRPSI
jgi:hypothetical protein